MSNPLINGLMLGLRFYNSIDQQCRYKYTCLQGVQHGEYQYTDACYMPPFQIMRDPDPSTDIDMFLVCADTEEEFDMSTYCPDMVNSITLTTVGLYDYISYLGVHTCCALTLFDVRTLVYIRLTDSVTTWYSELFYIDPAGVDDGDTNYRLWQAGGVRTVDLLDYRIHS